MKLRATAAAYAALAQDLDLFYNNSWSNAFEFRRIETIAAWTRLEQSAAAVFAGFFQLGCRHICTRCNKVKGLPSLI